MPEQNQHIDDRGGQRPDAQTGRNPFKFLDAYVREDIDIFYGREEELDAIYRKFYKSRIMLVYGRSGTGKSSLINCGLIARIPPEDVLVIPVRCSKEPVENLVTDLRKFTDSDATEVTDLLQDIYEENFKPISLVFDQFEEIFILATPEKRARLIDELVLILASRIRVNLVLIFREEYFAHFSEFEDLIPNLYENRVRVERMNKHLVKEIIVKPCKVRGVKVEPGFPQKVTELLSQESGQVELTWFQILMDKLFKEAHKRDPEQPVLQIADLEEIDDIGNILGDFLNEQLLTMEHAGEAEVVLKTMISEDGTKKQVKLDEITSRLKKAGHALERNQVRLILKDLVDRRIVSEHDKAGNYEIKHDSLAIRIYERLTAEERKLKEVQLLIKNDFKQYLKVGTKMDDKTLLYIDPYLDEIHIPPEQHDFIELSRKALKREKLRKRNIVLASALALLVIMSLFTGWAIMERNEAVRLAEIAQRSQEIAETQKRITEKANKQAELSKVLALKAKEFAELELYTNIANSISVSPLKMNVLYLGVDNPISISASGIDKKNLIPFCFDKDIPERKASIITKENQFIVKNINEKTKELIIGAYGISGIGDTLNLGREVFRVLSLPDPIVLIANKTGGNIGRSELLREPGLTLKSSTVMDVDYEIQEFEIVISTGGQYIQTERSESGAFTASMKDAIQNMDEGDLLIIENIQVRGPQGSMALPGMFFKVEGKQADEQRDRELKINELVDLAEHYHSTREFSKEFYVLDRAYHFDSNSLKIKKKLVENYYSLNSEYINKSRLIYPYKVLWTSKRGYVANLGYRGSGQLVTDTIPEGLFYYDSDSIRMIFSFDGFYSRDVRYIEDLSQFLVAGIKNNGKKSYEGFLLYIDVSGQIRSQAVLPSGTFGYVFPDQTGDVVCMLPYHESGGWGRDGRACLLEKSTGKLTFLWGGKYKTDQWDSIAKYISPLVRYSLNSEYIAALFSRDNRIEIWSTSGTKLLSKKVNGKLLNIAFSESNELLYLVNEAVNGEVVASVKKMDFINNQITPIHFEKAPNQICITNDGKYIIYIFLNSTKIYDINGQLKYAIPYPIALYSQLKEIEITNDRLIRTGMNYPMVFPLVNTEDEIIKLVREDKVFGELGEASEKEKKEVDKIISGAH